jgi:alpha-amylase/alpha-mannosidase (GH57 family)
MKQPLSVIFLWHMHQPYYKDPLRGEYALPWVYLHGIKDYYDMAAIVADTPGARVVFNLVPSLLEQLQDYVDGTAIDPFLVLARKPPEDLTDDERSFLIENFFSANRQRMIEPYPRYRELLCLAGDGATGTGAARRRSFRDGDLLDLQVWFFLAWTGEAARRHYPAFRELLAKGRNFSAADKELLFRTQQELLAAIIPLYRRLQQEGRVELSVTPYYHPILPLLCDLQEARVAMPRVTLPTVRFQHPEDARAQVARGVAAFTELFGKAPAGMWPSEGSVSNAALEVIADCGLCWAATDENILVKSLSDGLGVGREALYHPYRFSHGGRNLHLFFRDHALSDLIGFTYSQWDAENAVADFVNRLREIRTAAPAAAVVPVILDGENAWEYYPDNAYPFLTRLYQRIAAESWLELTTCQEFLSRKTTVPELSRIHAGSWINASYGIWIGHPEENLAWELLAKARATAIDRNPEVAALLATPGPAPADADPTAALIVTALYAAEGSDWFWWYGDDHFSPHADRFDALFRRHLMNVYRLLNLEIPPELYEPIKKSGPAGLVRDPAAMLSPRITGLVGDYFEWLAAGLYDLSRQSSAMHAAESQLQACYYGYDRTNLYLRVDGVRSLDKLLHHGDLLTFYLMVNGAEYRLAIPIGTSDGMLESKGAAGWQPTAHHCHWQIRRIAELRIPLAPFGLSPGAALFLHLTLQRAGEEIGRWPTESPLPLKYLGSELELDNWLI